MTEHSPTPWALVDYHNIVSPDIKAANGILICGPEPRGWKKKSQDYDLPNWRTNAEFIVRAVNAHDALLAAAEEVIAYVDASGDVPESIHGLLRAAISQARGEA